MSSKHLAAVTLFAAISATALLAMASAPAEAALPFSHPATAQRSAAPAVPAVIAELQARDASPRLIGHPASPRWAVQHANAEHPAIQARARQVALDANTFIVQPPASVTWTAAPATTISPISPISPISTAAR